MQKILLVFMVAILSICCSGCFSGVSGENIKYISSDDARVYYYPIKYISKVKN